MPIVQVFTNLPRSEIPQSFTSDLSDGLASILSVEAQKFQIIVQPGALISFAGTPAPSAALMLYAANNVLSADANDAFAEKITDLVVSKLGVPKDRIYMYLHAVDNHEAVYMGMTLAKALQLSGTK